MYLLKCLMDSELILSTPLNAKSFKILNSSVFDSFLFNKGLYKHYYFRREFTFLIKGS